METKEKKVMRLVEGMLLRNTDRAQRAWSEVKKRDFLNTENAKEAKCNAALSEKLALLADETYVLMSIKEAFGNNEEAL